MNLTHTPTTDADLDRLARKRAHAKMGWFTHALIYLCVNAGLALIAWHSGRHWPLFPLAGWGLGLAIHGVVVWLGTGGGGVYEHLLQRERQRLQ